MTVCLLRVLILVRAGGIYGLQSSSQKGRSSSSESSSDSVSVAVGAAVVEVGAGVGVGVGVGMALLTTAPTGDMTWSSTQRT